MKMVLRLGRGSSVSHIADTNLVIRSNSYKRLITRFRYEVTFRLYEQCEQEMFPLPNHQLPIPSNPRRASAEKDEDGDEQQPDTPLPVAHHHQQDGNQHAHADGNAGGSPVGEKEG